MRLERRSLYRRLTALACAGALACISALSHAASNVTLGTVTWIGYAPFYIADALDTYKKYGVSVKLVNFTDNSTMPGAVQGGSVDGALLTYDQVIGSAAKGWPLKVVLPIDYSSGGDAITSQVAITSVKDIKGKRVAYNPLSPSDFLLAYALKINGLSEADITPVHMTPEAVAGAMASGAVEVGVTYEPNVSAVVAAGGGDKYHVLYSSREAPGLITDVLVFRADYIEAHKAEITGIFQGYLDAMAYLAQEPDKAAEIVAKAMGITAEDVKAQLNEVHNPSLAEMPASFAKSEDISSFYASGEVIGDILLAKGEIEKKPAIATTLDDAFVQALLGQASK